LKGPSWTLPTHTPFPQSSLIRLSDLSLTCCTYVSHFPVATPFRFHKWKRPALISVVLSFAQPPPPTLLLLPFVFFSASPQYFLYVNPTCAFISPPFPPRRGGSPGGPFPSYILFPVTLLLSGSGCFWAPRVSSLIQAFHRFCLRDRFNGSPQSFSVWRRLSTRRPLPTFCCPVTIQIVWPR